MHGMFGLSGMGLALMALFWVAVVTVALVVGFRLLRSRPTALQRVPNESPLVVLRQRLVRGEIDAPTYARMVAELREQARRR